MSKTTQRESVSTERLLSDWRTEVAFWAKVSVVGECWLWNGAQMDRQDYGVFRRRLAHRVAWVLRHRQAIPVGLCVCHTCDNPKCVRPDHLWLGTQADNIKDMDRKGRRNGGRGERHGSAVLTNRKVRALRALWPTLDARGWTKKEAAAAFSLDGNTFGRAIRRLTYRDVV